MAGFTTFAILAGASAAMKAVGDWKSGSAAARAGEAQQRVAESQAGLSEYNAQVADLQAQDAIERGAEDESRFRTGVRNMVGKQRTGFAGAGIDVSYGTPVDVVADTAFMGELDARTIRTNAVREAWGFQVQGEDLRERARIARMEGAQALEAGKAARTAARIGAVAGIAGGAANIYAARAGFQDEKKTPSVRDLGPVDPHMLPGYSPVPR